MRMPMTQTKTRGGRALHRDQAWDEALGECKKRTGRSMLVRCRTNKIMREGTDVVHAKHKRLF